MASRMVKWVVGLSDLSHRTISLALTSAAVPLVQTLPPPYLATTCLTAVGKVYFDDW